jgi:hypothetical protein
MGHLAMSPPKRRRRDSNTLDGSTTAGLYPGSYLPWVLFASNYWLPRNVSPSSAPMPQTETPPNPASETPPPEPMKVMTRRFGEVDHTELVHLLDSLEGDQAKSRFRESIYISVIVYLLIAWFLVYGPRYLFHQGRIVPSAESVREKQQLTQLEMQNEIAKELAKPKFHQPVPKLDQRTMEQLKTMQRASEAAKAAQRLAPAPKPAPTPAPAPAPQQQAQVQPAPPPPAPLPRAAAPAPSAIPDAPRPNLPSAPAPSPSPAPSSSIAAAGRAATQPRFGGGSAIGGGAASRVGQQGAGEGAEILSDTRGVDFTDYIKKLLRMVRAQWIPLIPEECYPPLSKEGTTLIRFSIGKNGELRPPMTLDGPSGDRAIDKAAWGSIVGVGQFAPLPAAYTGDVLELRIQFNITHKQSDME